MRPAPAGGLSAAPSAGVAAVIEVGTTSARMAVGQRGAEGRLVLLDSLERTLGLGRDTFTSETISHDSMEQGIAAIRAFLDVLRPYRLPTERIRIVATSAVREARNGIDFADRVRIATGARMEVLDEADISRLTYLAVRQQLAAQRFFRQADTLVIEVGGGNTQTILFRKGRVSASHEYRLGSLRIERDLQGYQLSAHTEEILREYLQQSVDLIAGAVTPVSRLAIVALGSELRFACQQLGSVREAALLGKLSVDALEAFTRRILVMTPEETARTCAMTVTAAENLGPALYIQLSVARALRQKLLYVAEGSLRHGVLADLLGDPDWTEEFRRQVISSTVAVARRYRADLKHARHVAGYANALFSFLRERFAFDDRDGIILTVAALLHEIGMFVNDRSYHKHSLYLIENSEIFGIGSHDLQLAARVARYHRRATPKTTHEEYTAMSTEDRICVTKLAAILRVANALDNVRPHRAFDLDFAETGGRLRITVHSPLDLTLTRHHLAERAEMFRDVFGMRVVLRSGPATGTAAEDA